MEKLLWKVLHRRNLSGYRFLRQHPIFSRIKNKWVEFFIADFYSSELKLIIELDGNIHEPTKEYDSDRDSRLLNKEFPVIRIKNEEPEDMNSVILLLNEITNRRISQIAENKSNSPPSLLFKRTERKKLH